MWKTPEVIAIHKQSDLWKTWKQSSHIFIAHFIKDIRENCTKSIYALLGTKWTIVNEPKRQ